MKTTISKLTEKVTLQKANEEMSKTTEPMFCDVLETRASIKALNDTNAFSNLYKIIILKPPIKFFDVNFTAVKWRGCEYKYTTTLAPYQDKFLKGVISKPG